MKKLIHTLAILALCLPAVILPARADTFHASLQTSVSTTLTTPGYQLYQDGTVYGSHVTSGITALPGLYSTSALTLPSGHTYSVKWDDGGVAVASALMQPDTPTPVSIRTEMDSNSTKLAFLDAAVSTRLAAAAAPIRFNLLSIDTGGHVTPDKYYTIVH